jgi:type II secretory pathway pseudopilin PulG
MGKQYQKQRGFTIIEVILFLAIGSLLAVGVLAGSMASINNQRYADAVNSFKALIQEQYTNVTRVQNPAHAGVTCTGSAQVTAGAPDDRGTTDCELIGKLIRVSSAQNISIVDVVGVPPASPLGGNPTDLDILRSYAYGVSTEAQQDTTPQWGTRVRLINPTTGTYNIILLKSPASGTLFAFTTNTAIPDGNALEAFIGTSAAANQSDAVICVDPAGGVVPGVATTIQQQAVVIKARGSGPNAVEREVRDPCV